MASRAEQILSRMMSVAESALPGVLVLRSRERPVDVPAHVRINRGAEAFERFARTAENARTHFEVVVMVYATGEPWDQAADAMVIALHAALQGDALLNGSLADEFRLVSIEPAAAGSPADAGEFLLRYELQYLTRAAGLDSKPVNLI